MIQIHVTTARYRSRTRKYMRLMRDIGTYVTRSTSTNLYSGAWFDTMRDIYGLCPKFAVIIDGS